MSTNVEQHSPGVPGVMLVALTAEMLNECAELRARDDQQVFGDSNLYCCSVLSRSVSRK